MSDGELFELVHRVDHRVRRGYRERLEPLGVNPGQSRALRSLIAAGEPIRMARLAELLGIVPRSLTSVVDALESSGFVARSVDPSNRRSTLVSVTPAGLAVHERARVARREAAAEVFSVLSDEQRERLTDLLSLLDG
ncbi:MarR family winged helix-turn-helix transcriptional regulator [Herbidospora mongoliensis]|uniref:MarR family winged helix-turn-helix transcriptional regulator n=1 Tax=Herbidospora mongoliensis TaxID=688067 RepID=UPI000ADC87D3|nr:MarR family transcriptional regulator [Herbidospora mongoliensis]